MNNRPDNLIETAVVAALLHDVGVMAQRAADPLKSSSDHAALAATFAAERLPAPWHAASSAILAHHHPDDLVSKIVAAADRLAAGGPDDEDMSRPALQRQSPLAAIYADDSKPRVAFFAPGVLTTSPSGVTPSSTPLPRDDVRHRLGDLTERFATEHTLTHSLDFATYIEGLIDLLTRVGWAVSAPVREGPADIALSDHLRICSAVAACLGLDSTSDEQLDSLIAGDPAALQQPRALLLRGMLLGTQTFLRAIPEADAVDTLRGRHFYLGELTRAIADWTLDTLGLPPVCRLTVTNDAFELIAPLGCFDRLESLRAEIARRLLKSHDGELALALAAVQVSGEQISGAGSVQAQVGQACNVEKRRFLGDLSVAEQADLFRPRGRGGAGPICLACSRDLTSNDLAGGESENGSLCLFCRSVTAMGKLLVDANYLLVMDVGGSTSEAQPESALASFGRRVVLVADDESLPDLPSETRRARLERLGLALMTGTVRDWRGRQDAPVAVVSRVVARRWPRRPADAARQRVTIDEVISRRDEKQRAGILSVDLDSFRDLIGSGIRPAPSFARLIGVSWLIDLFFAGVVEQVVAQQEPERIGVVRGGGDDCLLIGHWSSMPLLAERLRSTFDRFVAGNPAIHFSASIVDGSGPFSLAYAVEQGHFSLTERAKSWRRPAAIAYRRSPQLRAYEGEADSAPPSRAKAGIDMLGYTFGWEAFLPAASVFERFKSLVANRGVPRTLLNCFLRVETEMEAAARRSTRNGSSRDSRPVFGRWQWESALALRQLAQTGGLPEADLNEFLGQMRSPDGIARLALAARWAEIVTVESGSTPRGEKR